MNSSLLVLYVRHALFSSLGAQGIVILDIFEETESQGYVSMFVHLHKYRHKRGGCILNILFAQTYRHAISESRFFWQMMMLQGNSSCWCFCCHIQESIAKSEIMTMNSVPSPDTCIVRFLIILSYFLCCTV